MAQQRIDMRGDNTGVEEELFKTVGGDGDGEKREMKNERARRREHSHPNAAARVARWARAHPPSALAQPPAMDQLWNCGSWWPLGPLRSRGMPMPGHKAQGQAVPVMARGGILPGRGEPLPGHHTQLQHRAAICGLCSSSLNGYKSILRDEPLHNL